MSNAADSVVFGDYVRLIHMLSRRAQRRLRGLGCRVDYDDIFQGMCLTWSKARTTYDPNLGVKFSTYFVRSAWRNFNRQIEPVIDEAKQTVSLDATAGDSDDRDLHQVIADEFEESAEDRMLREEARSRTLRFLSPLARRIVELIETPPEELMAMERAMASRAAYARSRGMKPTTRPRAVGVKQIVDLLALTARERHEVYAELRAVA